MSLRGGSPCTALSLIQHSPKAWRSPVKWGCACYLAQSSSVGKYCHVPHKRHRVRLWKYICKMVDYQQVRVDGCQGLWEGLDLSEELCAAHCSVSRPRPPIVATGGSTASLGGGRFTPKSSTAGAFGLGARAVSWTHLTPAADHLGPRFRAFPGDSRTFGSLYSLNHIVSEHMCTSSPCASPTITLDTMRFTSTKGMRVQCPVGHVLQVPLDMERWKFFWPGADRAPPAVCEAAPGQKKISAAPCPGEFAIYHCSCPKHAEHGKGLPSNI